MVFYDRFSKKPPRVFTKLDTDTCFVSQSEIETSSLSYQLKRYGMDSLAARLEAMRDKFGYADCTKNNDFATIQNQYRQAVDYFNALPSEVRRQFNDLPENFYESIKNNPKLAYEHNFISEETFKSLVGPMPVDIKNNEVDLVDTTQTPSLDSQNQLDGTSGVAN